MIVSMFAFTAAGAGKMDNLILRWREEDPAPEIRSYIKCTALEKQSDPRPLDELVAESWGDSDALIFWSSAGVAVRSIAKYLEHKSTDPAVLVLDELGEHCISLLSGHAGGANELAKTVAALTNAEPVITTASDVEEKFSVDVFARKNDLVVSDWTKAKLTQARVLQGKKLTICSELPREMLASVPGLEEQQWTEDASDADVIISRRRLPGDDALQLIPYDVFIGIGCRKDTPPEDVEAAYTEFLETNDLDRRAVECLASIDLKKEEPGLLALAEKNGLRFKTYSAEQLMGAEGKFSSSDFVKETTGADNVCERSAVTAAGKGSELWIPKTVLHGVTLAAAIQKDRPRRGRVSVIGIGPGDRKHMTEQAISVLQSADLVMGYQTYIRQVQRLFPQLYYRESGMREEIDRAREAFAEAEKGIHVAMVSSGDAQVYGMASLILEMSEEYPEVRVECVPGVTAALSGGALLGAPLGHDFVCISLSDLLTPWEVITRRLRKAAEGDFVIVLYNPSSRTRKEHFLEVCGILRETLPENTVCGWCREIGRDGEEHHICSFRDLPDQPVDMRTTVFIGNRQTKTVNGKMVTPRGYEL